MQTGIRRRPLAALGLATLLAAPGGVALAQEKLPVKVVVVTMFEVDGDEGDAPGEFQAWVERLPLPRKIDFPQGFRNLRYNPDKQVLGISTGMGTARSSASIMALGMDPRFDLAKAYWVVAGIAGADPNNMSVGSAAWAEWVVDADLAHEIDEREIPGDWTTGYLPLFKAHPYEQPVPADTNGAVFHLQPGLVRWAYADTKDITLADSEALRHLREKYTPYAEAQKPPSVMRGDTLSGMTFWHGKLLNEWANAWTTYWTGGQGDYVTTAMEDTGTMTALTLLGAAGKVDPQRVLVLRTASNYAMQYPGITAAQSLSGEMKGGYSAYGPSLDAAYVVGSKVVNDLVAGWAAYADTPPSAP